LRNVESGKNSPTDYNQEAAVKIFDFTKIPLKGQGRNHDFNFGGGLEVTIGGGLTKVEAEELKNLF